MPSQVLFYDDAIKLSIGISQRNNNQESNKNLIENQNKYMIYLARYLIEIFAIFLNSKRSSICPSFKPMMFSSLVFFCFKQRLEISTFLTSMKMNLKLLDKKCRKNQTPVACCTKILEISKIRTSKSLNQHVKEKNYIYGYLSTTLIFKRI